MNARHSSVSILYRTSLIALAVMSLPVTAAAQSTDASASSGGEGDIIVTARKRDERLIDTPIAISAFTADELRSAGVDEPGEFLNLTSGVFFRNNTTAGTSFVNIRGVTGSRNAESSVAVVVDGVYLTNPLSFQNQLIDLSQIEVLKGPQGALYGRNASAGAINITTAAPTNEFEGRMNVGIGRHLWRKANFSISGPIIEDKLLFRAVAYHSGTDGYLKNTFLSTPNNAVYGDKQSDTGGRLRFLFTPSDSFTADLRGAYTETSGGFNTTVGFAFGDPNPSLTGDEDTIFSNFSFSPNVPGFTKRKTRDLSLKLDWELGAGTLTSITAYNKLTENAGGDAQPVTPSIDGTQTLTNNYRTWSQELRYTSPDDAAFRYIVGGYFQKTKRLFSVSTGLDNGPGIVINNNPLPTPPGSVNPTTSLSADSIRQTVWSVFGQVSLDITDQLEASIDLRYDKDKERSRNIAPLVFQNPAFIGQVRRLKFDRLQPRFTLSYKPGIDSTLYASYAEGFKNGGFNPSGARATALQTNPNTVIRDEFGAEIAKTAEVGFKTLLLDDRVSLNGAAYWTRISGANYFDFVAEAVAQVNLNIDKIRIYGAEMDVQAKISDAFRIGANASYIDNKITKLAFRPAFEGNRSPAFPKYDLGMNAVYQDYVSENWQFFARGDVQHSGPIYWDLGNIIRRAPQTFINLRTGIIVDNSLGKSIRVELFCENCTNNDYINESLVLADIGTAVHFTVRDARVFGIEASLEF
jgi:iron complex outermembrane receptor protein